ncbi:hypothetical protein SteCoe_12975 [Stentor coeruleus]|uniref:Protein kinase domain-containing protein n=1 Tax=Stentor coeruleus TaxID=5963 RepID=A0A1R2C9I7_9CILI|nr:hypothetical protein SteCoe_12975 [Stentor coeruleus]
MKNILEITNLIGKGTFGKVFVANDGLGGRVAVKKLLTKDMDSRELTLLQQEISIMSNITHPNIVDLKFIIKTEDSVYLIMEYCEGGDLELFLNTHKGISIQLIRKWLSSLLSALAYLHSLNIMHRDLKLANFLLTTLEAQNADIKIADFGFAKIMASEITCSQVGSPLYMAPEIFHDNQYTIKADIWSLGIVFYEILTGRAPFACRTMAELIRKQNEQVAFPFTSSLPEEAKHLILSMININFELRPDSKTLLKHKFFTQECEDTWIEIDRLKQEYVFIGNDSEEEEKKEPEKNEEMHKSDYFEDYEESTFVMLNLEIQIIIAEKLLKFSENFDSQKKNCIITYLSPLVKQLILTLDDQYAENQGYKLIIEILEKLKKKLRKLADIVFMNETEPCDYNKNIALNMLENCQDKFTKYCLQLIVKYFEE